ncbi:MAG: pyruvate, phosphate dikinase [Planctomycetes bacterium]|nr:pyruvate, phosphate dikinase [Planctomycetota bacterium]
MGGELYLFGCRTPEPPEASPEAVGNKAANLIRMASAGLPVPPGFVLPTDLCRDYLGGGMLPVGTAELLRLGIRELEQATGQTFGGDRRPLLVSVRSGAPVSMPGMLDTVLNVGLCDRTLPALVRATGNPRHAWDSYRRLVQSYAEVVRGVSAGPFDQVLDEHLRREAVPTVSELDVAALKEVTRGFLDLYATATGSPFPQDTTDQLTGAVEAVFRSWRSPRAVEYRRLNKLDDLVGTAVTIQAMVFGNMGGTSGSGVGFSRNPATGENELYLDFLWNAQGEDVVSGRCAVEGTVGLQESSPELFLRLREAVGRLEALFHDAQDFEFTVQEGRLYLLQTRSAKRTPLAALRIACEQVAEGLIDETTGLARLASYDLNGISTVSVAATSGVREVGSGTPASPGVAVGEAVFDPQRAAVMVTAGRTPILIRADISTDDIAGLAAAAGILTARGGRTSHAAVVARQLNKVCVVGCHELQIGLDGQSCHIGDQFIAEGDPVSIDGHTGRVYTGKLEVTRTVPSSYLTEVEKWKAHVVNVVPSTLTPTDS